MKRLAVLALCLLSISALCQTWDHFDVASGKWLSAGGKPTQVAANTYISTEAPPEKLAVFGWLVRVPFVAPAGMVATGIPTYTPDYGRLQSVETFSTITQADANKAAADAQPQAVKDAKAALVTAAALPNGTTAEKAARRLALIEAAIQLLQARQGAGP